MGMTRDQLIEGLAAHIVENMDTVDLVQHVYDDLLEYYKDFHINRLLEDAEYFEFNVGEVTA